MRDNRKTKAELLQEVKTLRRRVAKLTKKENALQLSDPEWHSLLKNTPDIVMIVDRNGTIRFINHTIRGIKKKEVIGQKVYDFISSEHHSTMRKSLKKVFQTGRSASHEICGVGSHGDLSWYQSELGPIKQDGHIVAASIITRDVTEHRRIEEALTKSEENYRILVENQTDMVVKFDTDSTLLFASPSYCRTFGKSQEELNGSKFMPLIHEEDRKKVEETLNKVFKPPYTGYVEERALTKNGWRWQAWLNTAILNNEKKVDAIIGIGRDITERKRADDALRKSEKQFREIFENTAVGMYRTTPDGKILMANPALVHMLGYSSFKELSQRNLEEKGFEPQYQRSTFKEEIERKGRIISSESTWIRRDGKTLHVIENARTVRDEDGKTLYYEGTAENITERKQAEDELRLKNVAIESSINGVVFADMEGNIIYANKSFLKMWGYSDEKQVLGKHTVDFWADIDKAAEIKEITTKKGNWTGELVAKRKDGSIFDVQLSANLVKDENANPICKMATFIDITEHKRAEKVLKESEERYRTLFQGAAEGIIVADIETMDFKYANPAICKMLGYTEDELKLLSLPDIHRKEDFEYVVSEFKSQAEGKRILSPSIPCLRKDGTIIYADIKTTKLMIDGIECNVGFFTDTTERKKAEEEIEKFKEMADRATFGCAMSDLKGNLTYLNDSFAAMHGYTPAELIGKNLKIFHTNTQMKHVRQLNKKIRETGEGLKGEEVWHVHRDGTEFPTLMNNWTLKDSNGNPYQMCATAFDITERRRLEQTLRDSEEKYRTLVESADDSIAMFDNKGNFLFINERGAKQLGRRPRDFIGKTMHDFFPKKIADRQVGSVRKVIRTEKEIKEISATELQYQPRWYNTTIVPLRNSVGKVTAALVMARDIHEQKQAEEKLIEYRDKMIRAEQLAQLGALSSIVAHQFAQPLTTTQLSIDNALVKIQKGASQTAVVKKLRGSLTAVSHLTSILRMFQRHAGIPLEKNPTQVNLKAVAERTVQLLKESARRAKVNLYIKEMDELPTICSNEKDLEQIFFALVENAIQAACGKKKCRLVIRGTAKNKQVTLRFADTCGGITKKNLSKIFEPFFTTKPLSERTGLGLCVVELLVSRTGGKIRVESKRGKGSTFFISLPVNADGI
jgi:PAS domain S-box-containing protein